MGKKGKYTNGAPTPLGDWIKEMCQKQGLSLRQLAVRSSLSHGTISNIIKSAHPSSKTIKKLAECFAVKRYERSALLVLAGYRTLDCGDQSLNLALARLADSACQLREPQLTLLMRFAELLAETDEVFTSEKLAQTHTQN